MSEVDSAWNVLEMQPGHLTQSAEGGGGGGGFLEKLTVEMSPKESVKD